VVTDERRCIPDAGVDDLTKQELAIGQHRVVDLSLGRETASTKPLGVGRDKFAKRSLDGGIFRGGGLAGCGVEWLGHGGYGSRGMDPLVPPDLLELFLTDDVFAPTTAAGSEPAQVDPEESRFTERLEGLMSRQLAQMTAFAEKEGRPEHQVRLIDFVRF
jgi:hypothetical protein